MERLFPGAAGHIAEAAEALGTDAGCLDALAERLYETARGRIAPAPCAAARTARPRPGGAGAPHAPALVLGRRGPARPAADERALSHGDTLALAALARAEAGETCNLPLGLKAVAGRAYLYLLTQRDEPLSPAPAARPLPVTVHESAYVLDLRT